jgi:hypothetical protein
MQHVTATVEKQVNTPQAFQIILAVTLILSLSLSMVQQVDSYLYSSDARNGNKGTPETVWGRCR